jgi:hypothetical protein
MIKRHVELTIANEFAGKPFSIEMLMDSIEMKLEQSQVTRALRDINRVNKRKDGMYSYQMRGKVRS